MVQALRQASQDPGATHFFLRTKKMKTIFLLAAAILATHAYADQKAPCTEEPTTKYFISNWNNDNDTFETLTAINTNTGETTISEGRLAYSDDLNNDTNNDAIFKSFEGVGSSNESTFDILIKCRGFYVYAGGDYYADVKPSKDEENNYKKIIAKSYKRDPHGQIIYKGKDAMLTSETLYFNPEEMKYTTKSKKP